MRTPIDFLPDGSIVCQGEIPLDSEVHLMISNKDICLQTTDQVASATSQSLADSSAEVFFIFESTNRQKVLGRYYPSMIESLRNILGFTTPIFGMGTFGEICNINQQQKSILYHNGCLGILTLS
jgi:hypothetical protein